MATTAPSRTERAAEQVEYGLRSLQLARGSESTGRSNPDAEQRAARHFEKAARILRGEDEE